MHPVMTKYASLNIKGSSGIVLDNGNVIFKVWDEEGEKVVGNVTLGTGGVTLSGARGRNARTVSWDELNK